jgi:hypothetical protein
MLKGNGIECTEKQPNKILCEFHQSLFEIWATSGGYKIYSNDKLSLEEKRKHFIEDLNKINFEKHSEFTTENFFYFENEFAKICKIY